MYKFYDEEADKVLSEHHTIEEATKAMYAHVEDYTDMERYDAFHYLMILDAEGEITG